MRRRFTSAVFSWVILASLGATPSIFDEAPPSNGPGGKPVPTSRPASDVVENGANSGVTGSDANAAGIRNAYAGEIARANTPAASAALIKRLLKASDAAKEPARQVAFLQVARELAERVGDLPSAADVIGKINAILEREFARGVLPPAELREAARSNLSATWHAAGEASAIDLYDLAVPLAGAAQKNARLTLDRRSIDKADAVVAMLAEMGAASRTAAAGRAAIRKDPIDPAAYLAMGRYECFFKGKWERGLPDLAGSTDPILKPLAITDLAKPINPDEQGALGDAWCKVAGTLTPLQRPMVYAHAIRWYQTALPGLTGLERQRVDKKLAEISTLALSHANEVDDGFNILNTMSGAPIDPVSGIATIQSGNRLISDRSFHAPARFRVVAMTDKTDIRIGYAADEIIFNWDGNLDELRIGGGPSGGRAVPAKGRVPTQEWVTIDLDVFPTLMTLRVDGSERYQLVADFSQVDQRLSLFTSGGSTMRVKSVKLMGN